MRYVETSTESGFEHFVDGRADGLGAMLGAATSELGMSFELERSLEVMKEFQLSGLAGANVSDPKELLAGIDSQIRRAEELLRDGFPKGAVPYEPPGR